MTFKTCTMESRKQPFDVDFELISNLDLLGLSSVRQMIVSVFHSVTRSSAIVNFRLCFTFGSCRVFVYISDRLVYLVYVTLLLTSEVCSPEDP